MAMRPVAKVRQVLAGEAIKVIEEGAVSIGVDTLHTMPPAEHGIAIKKEGDQEDVSAARIADDRRNLMAQIRSWH